MGYRIQYGSFKYDKKTFPQKKLQIIAALSILVLVVLICLCFPEQTSVLRAKLFPFLEPEVTEAFEQMMFRLGEGERISDAAAAFCREIIDQSAY